MHQKEASDLSGSAIRGSVYKIDNEKLYLHLATDIGTDKETSYSYPYYPFINGSAYTVPEIGAEVALYFPDSDPANALVRNCFSGLGNYPHSSVKYLKTPHHKMMKVHSDQTIYRTESESGIQAFHMVDRSNLGFKASQKIPLFARGNIIMKSNASSSVTAAGSIDLLKITR